MTELELACAFIAASPEVRESVRTYINADLRGQGQWLLKTALATQAELVAAIDRLPAGPERCECERLAAGLADAVGAIAMHSAGTLPGEH